MAANDGRNGVVGPSEGPFSSVARSRVALYLQDGHPVRDDMAFAQLAPLDHPKHVVWQLEQADPVGDGRLRPPHALRNLAEREAELVDEDGVRA